MQFGKKFLYSLLAVMIFCLITSGGCGGGSSDSSSGSEENGTSQNQNQNQNTPDTPNTPSPAPDTASGLNGTWQGEKGSGSFSGGYVNYDEQYLDYTLPRNFTIALTKNTSDDYYTIVFSGDGVSNSGKIDSYITAVFYTKGAANVDSENGEAWSHNPFLGAGNKFEKAGDTVYRMTNSRKNSEDETVDTITTFTLLDSSRVECRQGYHFVDDEGFEHEGTMIVFNIKRVTQ